MNGEFGRVPRMIVGISRSRASWWALAWAVGEARRRGARLLLVHIFRPPVAPVAADYRYGVLGVLRDPYGDRMERGHALIHAAVTQAVGWMPGDVAIEQQVLPGRAAAVLARLARGDDVIVLGCRRRGLLRRLAPGSVGRACARRADCPVVAVPEPSATALAAGAAAGPVRTQWRRWVPHRGARTAS
jgi:nucleotide-binding universal stress UspA family protein